MKDINQKLVKVRNTENLEITLDQKKAPCKKHVQKRAHNQGQRIEETRKHVRMISGTAAEVA